MKLIIILIVCALAIADNESTDTFSPKINIGSAQIELTHTEIYADNDYGSINTGFEVSNELGFGTIYAQGDIGYGHTFGHNGKADYGGRVGYRFNF